MTVRHLAPLDAAFSGALAAAIYERLLARAVIQALARVEQRGKEAPDRRAALGRGRDAIAVGIRRLLEAVKHRQANDTLLAELAAEEKRRQGDCAAARGA